DPRTVRQLHFNPNQPRAAGPVIDSDEIEEKPSASTKNQDALQFDNGDFLFGNLISLEPKSALRWSRPDALRPLEFEPDAISEIQLSPRAVTNADLTNLSKISFFDGDELDANVLSVDSEIVICDN